MDPIAVGVRDIFFCIPPVILFCLAPDVVLQALPGQGLGQVTWKAGLVRRSKFACDLLHSTLPKGRHTANPRTVVPCPPGNERRGDGPDVGRGAAVPGLAGAAAAQRGGAGGPPHLPRDP